MRNIVANGSDIYARIISSVKTDCNCRENSSLWVG